MPRCETCGRHVSKSYARVFADGDGIFRCPSCDSSVRLMAGSAAGRDVEHPDPLAEGTSRSWAVDDDRELVTDGGAKDLEFPKRGPNGIPYVDPDATDISAWKSGHFRLRIARRDGEVVYVNLTGGQAKALEAAIRMTREDAAESPRVDYDGDEEVADDG